MKNTILTFSEILVLFIGIGASLHFLAILKITNFLAWLLFGGWVLAPYFAAVIRSYFLKKVLFKRIAHFIAFVAAVIAGLYLLIDAIYINPDPQGGLLVLMVPIFQIPIYFLLYFFCVLAGEKSSN